MCCRGFPEVDLTIWCGDDPGNDAMNNLEFGWVIRQHDGLMCWNYRSQRWQRFGRFAEYMALKRIFSRAFRTLRDATQVVTFLSVCRRPNRRPIIWKCARATSPNDGTQLVHKSANLPICMALVGLQENCEEWGNRDDSCCGSEHNSASAAATTHAIHHFTSYSWSQRQANRT